jgi:hypothetical protein
MKTNYHLAIRRKDGAYKRLTRTPMSHDECRVMKSKFSTEEQSRIIFQPEAADPDHGPIGNNEAVLLDEIRVLRAEKEVLMAKLSRMCGDA